MRSAEAARWALMRQEVFGEAIIRATDDFAPGHIICRDMRKPRTMPEFTLNFAFNHADHTASVSVLRSTNHIQYTIVPDDRALEEKFATQVVHRFGDKLEFAFPGKGEEAKRYNEALEKSLKEYIKRDI
jgi:hypothetical protein